MAVLRLPRGILMAVIWQTILNLLGWLNVFAQVQPDCDFRYYLQFGDQQVLSSPGFDQGRYYDPGKVCRWAYTSPRGTVLDVNCNPIDLPSSNQCQQDRLVFSLTGNPNLSDGQNYCGSGTLRLTSTTNALTIGLVSASNSPGGRYRCIITPIAAGGTPPITTTTTPKPTNCDCGWKQQRRIVGGMETGVNEYPFMAAIIRIDRRSLWCGAAIISNRYALTAAHCLLRQVIANLGLLVGDHNLKEGWETSAAKLYAITSYQAHPQYNQQTQNNDIAVVRTNITIVFSVNVGPICLPYRYTNVDFTGAPVTAMGWGTLFFNGPTADALQAVNLTVIDNDDCQTYFQEPITNSEICTYADNKDACTYDSGGPVIWFDTWNTNRCQLIGLISFGRDCATDAPGVNTKVSSFLNWILQATPDASYCWL